MRKLSKDIHQLFNTTIVILIIMLVYIYNLHPISMETFSNNQTVFSKGSNNHKTIALSFDDGPHPQYTNEILDILKEYNIKATFFVLGLHAESYPDIILRQIEEGHEIGNHSYSHINMKKATKKEIIDEYDKTQKIVYSISNVKPTLFRPPYGNYNSQVVEVVSSDDSTIVLWTFYQDSKDWSNPGVEVIVNTTVTKAQSGDIILFHDYVYHKESHTIEALKILIPTLINEGYSFVTISELMESPYEKEVLNQDNN